ncbi:MAG: hypothetical protein LIO46_01095 [Clostridiales bacterium]|nr:hypothetical protein [Clostridiales bacterium]
MLGALGIGAFAGNDPAAASKDFEGQGYIANENEGTGEGPGDMIDLEIPANGFFWYANTDTKQAAPGTFYDIKSKEYTIKNNSEKINLLVTLTDYYQLSTGLDQIENSSTNEVDPTKVIVALDGDLADASITDLVNDGVIAPVTYTKLLGAKGTTSTAASSDTWTYSFIGEYQSTILPTNAHTSDYVMVLEFEAVGSTGEQP